MKTTLAFWLLSAMLVIAQYVPPLSWRDYMRTNSPTTGTFTDGIVVGETNVISTAGSKINGVGVTNGTMTVDTVTAGTFSSASVAADMIDSTNIIDHTLGTNDVDSTFYALITAPALDTTADYDWSGSNYFAGSVVIAGTGTNIAGETRFSANVNVAGTLTASNIVATNVTIYGTNPTTVYGLQAYGDANATNALTMNAGGLTVSNANGTVTTTSGNLTASGTITGRLYGTNVANTTITWVGPSNALALVNGCSLYQTAGNCAITNVTGITAGANTWHTLGISNSTAGAINLQVTAVGLRAIGTATTNSLSIPAGKVGVLSVMAWGNLFTNYVCAAQQ
jgi:hypothetical protein